jgi:hypothetical protein
MSALSPTKNTTVGRFKTPIGQDLDIFQTFDEKGVLALGMDYQGNIIGYDAVVGNIVFPGVPTGSCAPPQTAVNSANGNFYDCVGGVWTLVTGSGSLTSPITSPNPLQFNVNPVFKGSIPWTDVTAYGVRSTATNLAPMIPGITATIAATGNTATLSSASTFQNGDGVCIYGAGAANGLTTPTAPTILPCLAAAGTGTGLVTGGGSGSTTYNYQIVARNQQGGLTPAGSVGTITTGNASLGQQSVAITSSSRSGTTVTVTTASAHGLVSGAMVYIAGTSNDLNFGGWYVVASVPDNTHFTYPTGLDSAGGALTAGTGGTVVWFNCNHVSWTQVTGAFEYYIYGSVGAGSLTLLGISRPQNSVQGIFDPTWDDFGTTMMGGISLPYYVPTTPPVSALANPLVTTILSGAGTTTLTLAASATTSVTNSTILFDNTPNIQTAAANCQFGSLLYFPGGTYVVNSFLTIPSFVSMSLAGCEIFLNDTMSLSSGDKVLGMIGAQGQTSASFAWSNIGGFIQSGRANPVVYVPNSQIYMDGISITGNGNASQGLILDGGSQGIYKNCVFSDGVGGTADYMGMPVLMRQGFWYIFDTVTLLTGPGQSGGGFNGTTATPALYANTGSITFRNMSVQDRGIFLISAATGSDFEFKGSNRAQGIITPFCMTYFTGGTVAANFIFSDVEMDTAQMGIFANLQSNTGSMSGSVNIINGNGSPGVGNFTGAKVGFAIGSISGQNVQAIAGSSFTNNFVQVLGTGQIGYQMSTPSAPVSAVVSSGGNVPVGAHTYAITAVDMNGIETILSPSISATTTTGNQTVTVTPPTLPLGSKAWRPYRDGLLATVTPCSTATIAPNATYVDVSASACNNSAPSSNVAAAAAVSTIGFSGFQSAYSPTLFANLGTPANGIVLYCADCNIANPCTGSGTGAIAKRLNGVWICN